MIREQDSARSFEANTLPAPEMNGFDKPLRKHRTTLISAACLACACVSALGCAQFPRAPWSAARVLPENATLADLASAINTQLKGVIDNYVNSREMNNKEEVAERFEGLTREVLDQKLSGTKTICEKVMKVNATGNYKTYVAIELSAQDLLAAYNERLSSDERLRIDYDYEKFKETFEAEMNKLGNK